MSYYGVKDYDDDKIFSNARSLIRDEVARFSKYYKSKHKDDVDAKDLTIDDEYLVKDIDDEKFSKMLKKYSNGSTNVNGYYRKAKRSSKKDRDYERYVDDDDSDDDDRASRRKKSYKNKRTRRRDDY